MSPRLAILILLTPALTPIQLLGCAELLSQLPYDDFLTFLVMLLVGPGALGLGITNALMAAHTVFESHPIAQFVAALANIIAVGLAWALTFPLVVTSWS